MGLVGMGSEGFSPFFFFLLFSFFFAFLRFILFYFVRFFFVFPLFIGPILLGQEQTTAIYLRNGEFHADPPSAPTVQNFPKNHRFDTFWAPFWDLIG